MKLTIKKETTSKIVHIFIADSSSTTGTGLAGLVHNTTSLSAYYVREGNPTSVLIPLVDITTLGTFVSGGFKEYDSTNMPGLYELHLPDAVLADGAESTVVLLKGAANMAPLPFEIQLDDNTIKDCYDQNEEIKGSGFTSTNSLALRPVGGGSSGGGHCAWYDADINRAKNFFTSSPLKMKEIADALSALSNKISTPTGDATIATLMEDFAAVRESVNDMAEGLKMTDKILLSIADAETLEGLLDGE